MNIIDALMILKDNQYAKPLKFKLMKGWDVQNRLNLQYEMLSKYLNNDQKMLEKIFYQTAKTVFDM